MPLVQSKYRMRSPDESLDGHEADILRPSTKRTTKLIRRNPADPFNIGLVDTQRVCKRGRLTAQQRLLRALHALRKQLAVMLNVLVDRPLDELRLLKTRHQRGIADLLLGGLMDSVLAEIELSLTVPRARRLAWIAAVGDRPVANGGDSNRPVVVRKLVDDPVGADSQRV